MLKVNGFDEYSTVIDYDFSCWVIKYGCVSINGKIYKTYSITVNERKIIPLLWNHRHNDPEAVLGYAKLQKRDEGIYAYCTFNNHPSVETAKKLISDRGSVSLSPYINKVKTDGKYITAGIIREVSLVLARVDPDEAYYPVMKQN